jgi:hypothetical protein
MATWLSADLYIESCTSLKAKIAAIELIQEALLTSALKAASKGAVSQYSLNDGQTTISATYRNAKEITESYNSFEAIKQMFLNRLRGRVVRLIDSKNFTGNGF